MKNCLKKENHKYSNRRSCRNAASAFDFSDLHFTYKGVQRTDRYTYCSVPDINS